MKRKRTKKAIPISYEYLTIHDGPVIEGLEGLEVVYAKDQPQYLPLRALRADTKEGLVLTRWTLTPKQRKAVAAGADVFLELLTFRQPLQPIRIAIGNGKIDPEWVKVALLSADIL
jgi:hypothetical protein